MFVGGSTVDNQGGILTKAGWNCAVIDS